MFNFLVTASSGAWDRPGYEYDLILLCHKNPFAEKRYLVLLNNTDFG